MHIWGVWTPNHQSDDSQNAGHNHGLRIACSSLVTTFENADWKLVYQGTIFDRTDEELLSRQSALDTAFGLYTYVKIAKGGDEIVLGTDRFGFSPLYYSTKGETLSFATSLTQLKYRIGSSTPDFEAWEELLNLGTILGDKTTISEIKRLPPGTRIHLRNGKIIFSKYWQLEVPEISDKASFISRSNDLLAEALEHTRKVPNRKIVPLSGGEDSRRIAISAHSIGLPVSLLTQEGGVGSGLDKDIIPAKKVAAVLKLPHTISELPSVETLYRDSLLTDYWLGYEAHAHFWMPQMMRTLPPDSLIYEGLTGDLTVNAHAVRIHPSWYKCKTIDQTAGQIVGDNPQFRAHSPSIKSSLFERVRQELMQMPECPARVDYFNLMTRNRRNTSLGAHLYSLMGHKMCHPYLYYPFFMHSVSLAPFDKLDCFLQRECMRKVNPEATAVPTTRDRLDQGYSISRADIHKSKNLFFARRTSLNRAATEIFPVPAMHLLLFRMAAAIGYSDGIKRFGWKLSPVARVSDFLEWIADGQTPAFPPDRNEPALLKQRLLQRGIASAEDHS